MAQLVNTFITKKSIGKKTSFAIFIWIFGILFSLPIFLALINSFKTQGEIILSTISLPSRLNPDNYLTILSSSDLLGSFLCSLIVSGMTAILVVLFSSFAGYALARWKSKASSIIATVFMTTLFVPFQIYMIALILTAKALGCTNNMLGLILVNVGISISIPVFLVRGYVKSTISIDIENAAVIDGCGTLQLFFRIIMPLLTPILATVGITNGLWAWNDFLTPLLIYGNAKPRTLPLTQQFFFGMYSMKWNLIMAGFILSSIPAVIFFLFMQRYIIKGISAGAIKG